MSRMVRDNEISGLRERLFFARSLLAQVTGEQANATPAVRLALRGGVVFHLYAVLVGLVRQAAKTYRLPDYDDLISLAALERAFDQAGVEAPEVALVRRARADRSDLVAWLDQEMRSAVGAAGLARRPTPPSEADTLNLMAEDSYAPLAEGDLARLKAAGDRVQELVEHCVTYMDEW